MAMSHQAVDHSIFASVFSYTTVASICVMCVVLHEYRLLKDEFNSVCDAYFHVILTNYLHPIYIHIIYQTNKSVMTFIHVNKISLSVCLYVCMYVIFLSQYMYIDIFFVFDVTSLTNNLVSSLFK